MASLNTNPLHLLYVLFFSLHALATIFFDSQLLFPRSMYPSWATEQLDWHVKTFNDHQFATRPAWFVTVVWCEVLFTLPFFFVAAYAIFTKKSWIRIPAIMYGTHVSTCMAAMLGDILFGPQHGPHSEALAYVNLPFLVVPFCVMVNFALDSDPFRTGAGKKAKAA